MSTIVRGGVVTPDGVIDDGIVVIEGDRIADIRPAGPSDTVHMRATWVVPGFVDIHCHGGGGHTFTTGDADDARAAAQFHATHGTTTMLASLVTSGREELVSATAAFGPLVADGTLAGIHFEGPYLSPARSGAQNPAHLRDPDPAELAALIDMGGVRMITIAPELPGALETIALAARRGVIAAIGHTDATYDQTRAGIAAGASVGTHVCNGMRPVHHREPGPIVALLDAEGVVCEQIADGVHLHDGMLRHSIRAAGTERVALITDAMAATGMPDGEYELGGLAVRVVDGVARLVTDGAIAGSTLTMDVAFRRTVQSGVSLVDAARMAATTPARVLGIDDELGALVPGHRADLVLLDEGLRVTGVLRAGERVVGFGV
jgi:N-acetylglucosamine-6-phosphate deacetylase